MGGDRFLPLEHFAHVGLWENAAVLARQCRQVRRLSWLEIRDRAIAASVLAVTARAVGSIEI
jgi:hypothetical protein